MKRLAATAVLILAAIGVSAQFLDVPAFHSEPPPKGTKLPAILSGLQLSGPSFQYPWQTHAYVLAAKIPNVLYQQPCYCRCDRSVGHKSLHSCFESAHGAHCAVCLKEAYLAYEMNKQGKTAAEIREAIMRGDWQKVDLATAAAIN